MSTLFSSAIYWQLNAVRALDEKGYYSNTPPILRATLENITRMIYYERKATQQEREDLISGRHQCRLKSFGQLLRKAKADEGFEGELSSVLSVVQVKYATSLWNLLSAYAHVGIEECKVESADPDVIGIAFPLKWLIWELHLSANTNAASITVAITDMVLRFRTLHIQAQLLNLIASGHYLVIQPDLTESTLGREFAERYIELLGLHSRNKDLLPDIPTPPSPGLCGEPGGRGG